MPGGFLVQLVPSRGAAVATAPGPLDARIMRR